MSPATIDFGAFLLALVRDVELQPAGDLVLVAIPESRRAAQR